MSSQADGGSPGREPETSAPPRWLLGSTCNLLARSLRLQGRSFGGHAARLGLAALLLLSLLAMRDVWSRGGAAGTYLLMTISIMLTLVGTLACIALFASAVTDEKEEGNLGLLRMAGLGPSGLLAGVGLARLWDVLLLTAVAVPPTLLAVTLGGVTAVQVFACFIAILAYFVLIAGLGLLASTISGTGARAGALVIGSLIVLHLLPLLTYGILCSISGFSRQGGPLSWWLQQSVWSRLGRIASTGYSGGLWSWQIGIDLGIGAIALTAAWLLFARCARDSHEDGGGGGGRRRRLIPLGAPPRGVLAVGWKDFHAVCGGWLLLALKLVIAVVAAVLLAWLVLSNRYGDWRHVGKVWLSVGLGWLVVEWGLHLSRLFANEARERTLGTLMALPHSAKAIAYAKLLWSLVAVAPAILLFACGALASPHDFGRMLGEMLSDADGWFFISCLVIFLHLAAWFSLRFKRFALVAAVAAVILIAIITGFISSMARSSSVSGYAAFALFVASGIIHFRFATTLERMAGRD